MTIPPERRPRPLEPGDAQPRPREQAAHHGLESFCVLVGGENLLDQQLVVEKESD